MSAPGTGWEKPFYYAWKDGRLAFASGVEGSGLAVGAITVNPALAYAYLDGGRLDYTDETFVEQVRQLEPAHYLLIKDGRLVKGQYWAFQSTGNRRLMNRMPPCGEGFGSCCRMPCGSGCAVMWRWEAV
ncbi:MAG: hypothetical protein U0231_00665 [Nitrospiraceae bacterium]